MAVSPDFAVVLSGGKISVEARPLEGETPMEFAARLVSSPATAGQILALPGEPSTGRPVVVPYAALADEVKLAAVTALFPADVRATAGWLHIAVSDETLAAIAEWFIGRAELAAALARENGLASEAVGRGTTVRIPAELLLRPFRDAEALDETEPPHLAFGEDEKGRYAVYRLRKKEALYSAVVVRFTGRVHAADVIELAGVIAARSGIEDVRAIPVGYPVKIPLDVLSEEYLPPDDPRARTRALERAETAQFAQPAAATGLAGVRVVVDAGHGGRDTGTIHGGLWEATYVYDVAVRLRKLLLDRTRADVVLTTKDAGTGWKVVEKDRLPSRKSQVLLTDPPYDLADPVVGVNLRWYLANSLMNRPGPEKKKIPPERTVFVSLHADSLHPSLRGAMVYVPGERFLRDRYGKRGEVFAAYREWRELPVVAFSRRDRVASEGASTALAGKIVASMRRSGLAVHPFSPVRTHVIRAGREWVPAVLRYNRIPNRVLVEVANLANEEDRALLVTRRFRQDVAEAVAAGLLDFFGADRG
ncbi:MAG TPA: N-acetylmuramoyl-L-alanine amidase, partial [Thermoanaerobaculia bacterium]|nr:N-acetylmuramoyl-L-alanine amidase [Thermoanaerobaculia bacterium]